MGGGSGSGGGPQQAPKGPPPMAQLFKEISKVGEGHPDSRVKGGWSLSAGACGHRHLWW